MPVTLTGTNALAMAGQVSGFSLSTYANYMMFCGIASATNTGAVTAQYAALSALNVYKDTPTGPSALTGGEIVSLNAVYLTYDSALNSGSGGFHLFTPPTTVSSGGNLNVSIVSANVTFSSITRGGTSDALVSFGAVSIGNVVAVGMPAQTTQGIGYVPPFCSVSGTIVLRAFNYSTIATLQPPSGAWNFMLLPNSITTNQKFISSIVTATLTYPSIIPGGSSDQVISFPAVTIGDVLIPGFPAQTTTGIAYLPPYVSANGSIILRAFNYNTVGGATIQPPLLEIVNIMMLRISS